MAVLDADGDGSLDAGEFRRVAQPSRRFEDFDLDESGRIDVSELRVALMNLSPLLPDYRGVGSLDGRPELPGHQGLTPALEGHGRPQDRGN